MSIPLSVLLEQLLDIFVQMHTATRRHGQCHGSDAARARGIATNGRQTAGADESLERTGTRPIRAEIRSVFDGRESSSAGRMLCRPELGMSSNLVVGMTN